MMYQAESLFEHAPPGGGRAGTSAVAMTYDPPAIRPSLLALTNRLSQRRAPVTVVLGDAVVGLAPVGLGSIDDAASPAERVVFRLQIDGRPLLLVMAKGLYERILARIDPELLAAEIDPDILPLLLESCIEDGLATAEAGLQSRIELVAVEQGTDVETEGLDVALETSIDGEKAGPAAIRAAAKDIDRLADLLAARPRPPRSFGEVSTALRFRARAIWLDLCALKALKTGDVLVIEDDASRWDRMAAAVGEHWLFPIELTRAGPTVRGRLRRADPRDQDEWMMVEQNQANDDEEALGGLLKGTPKRADEHAERGADQNVGAAETRERSERQATVDAGPAAGASDAALDDLPVKLMFELGRMEIPLGQLQEIGPGHVFQLDRPLGEAVEIHAGGRRIGQGEVIRIENQVGVRIVRLFGQGGA